MQGIKRGQQRKNEQKIPEPDGFIFGFDKCRVTTEMLLLLLFNKKTLVCPESNPSQTLTRHCEARSAVAISGKNHRAWSVLIHVKEYVMKRQPAVYFLTNKPDGTLYTGVTSDLPKRIWQHKNRAMKGFSARYNLTRLVYFELFEDMHQAISREKQIKAGSRKAKIKLIESNNPEWRDLYAEVCD